MRETQCPRAAQDPPGVQESPATLPGRTMMYPEMVRKSGTRQLFQKSTRPGSVPEIPAQRRLPRARQAPLAPDNLTAMSSLPSSSCDGAVVRMQDPQS